jgi:TPR repeat protein
MDNRTAGIDRPVHGDPSPEPWGPLRGDLVAGLERTSVVVRALPARRGGPPDSRSAILETGGSPTLTSQSPRSESVVCASHGLRYDPEVHAGCVVCRRVRRGPDGRGRALATIAVGVMVVGGVGALLAHITARRAQARAPGPSDIGPELATVAASAVPAAGVMRVGGFASPGHRVPNGPGSRMAFPNLNCVTPFLVSDPVAEMQELRRRCDANDAEACTHLGFACDDHARGRYPAGVVPSTALTEEQCKAKNSSPALMACSPAGLGPSWYDRGCNGGDFLGCLQPVAAWQVTRKRFTEAELREKAGEACEGGMAAACYDLARPPLFTSATLAAAYRRIGAELSACSLDGGAVCMPSADMLDALARAKSAAASEAIESADAKLADLQRRCDAGLGSACSALAQHYLEGPAKDPVRAVPLARRACDLGSGAGCFALSSLYGAGEGLPRDEAQALAFNARAEELTRREVCEDDAGSIEACISIIKGLNASNAERSTALAPDTAHAGCAAGDPAMCMDLARLYAQGGGPLGAGGAKKDLAMAAQFQGKAVALWKERCERGEGAACRVMAQSLAQRGDGQSPDIDRAAAYAKKGCNEGHDPGCCYILAGMYKRGEGVVKDEALGERCYRATWAASQADAEAPACP